MYKKWSGYSLTGQTGSAGPALHLKKITLVSLEILYSQRSWYGIIIAVDFSSAKVKSNEFTCVV